MIAFYLVAAIIFLVLGVVWKVDSGLNFICKLIMLAMMLWGFANFIIKLR